MREIIPLLQIIMKSINDLTDDEYQKLIEGKGKLIYVDQNKKVVVKKNAFVEQYKQKLEQISNRDEAYNILKDLKKSDLLDFAGSYHVYALKSDKKEVIIEKIIESFIGVKLRYKAMKTIDLSYKMR